MKVTDFYKKAVKRIAKKIKSQEEVETGEDDRLLNEIISRIETNLRLVNNNVEYTKGTSKEEGYQKVAEGLQMVLDILNNMMYGDPEYHDRWPEQSLSTGVPVDR